MHGGDTYSLSENVLFLLKRASAMSLSSSARERERSAARGGGMSGERAHRGDRGKQREEDLKTPRSSLTTSLHRALLRQYL